MSDTVLLERRDDGVAVITLNRPERLNAITDELVRTLHDRLDEAAADLGCRAVVMTGAGRGFCAGFDLKSDLADDISETRDDVSTSYRQQQRWSALVAHVRSLRPPVIAAVNGPAAGGGFALAAAADLRVISTTATFLVANVKIGLSGGEFGLSYTLPRILGTGRAAELLYTGRRLDAVEADRWGFANRLVEPDELLPTAFELAGQLAANSAFAVALTKEMFLLAVDSPSLEHTLVLENRTQTLASRSGDIAEAIAAFREKRPPQFGDAT